MALKTAKMFKDFIITWSSEHDMLAIVPRETQNVFVKNDNFATQVTIKCDTDINFFDYKYITFDDKTIFEITDVIKNKNYATLFIRYLTYIDLSIIYDTLSPYVTEKDLQINGVSAATLSKLGLDVNEVLRVLGKNAKQDIYYAYAEESDDGIPSKQFFYAVKLRFSECPQNLTDMIVGESPSYSPSISEKEGITGKDLADATFVLNTKTKITNTTISRQLFNGFDSAFTAILIIPWAKENGVLTFINTSTGDEKDASYKDITFQNFLYTLDALISDLTISAELVLYHTGELVTFSAEENARNMLEIKQDVDSRGNIFYRYCVPLSPDDFGAGAPNPVRFSGMIRRIKGYYPVFCLNSYKNPTSSTTYKASGFAEIFAPYDLRIKSPSNYPDRIYTSLRIMGNEVDLRECRENYVTIYRHQGGARIYSDFARNVYTDIVTTFEYTKNAYSDYEAYKKANIELVQNQKNVTLIQQQQQERDVQTTRNVFTGINAGINAIKSGNIFGALDSIVSGGMHIAQEEVQLNMAQQNERANIALANEQELERARATIIPASEMAGSLSLLSELYSDTESNNFRYAFWSYRFFDVTTIGYSRIENFVFENTIIDKVIDFSQIRIPEWQKKHDFYQYSLTNFNKLNTKKSVTIYGFGGRYTQSAKNAEWDGSSLAVLENTGFVTGFNTASSVNFHIRKNDDKDAYVDVFVRITLPRVMSDISSYWRATIIRGLRTKVITPKISLNDFPTNDENSIPIYIGRILLDRSEITLIWEARIDNAGSVDGIEIYATTPITFANYEH